MQSLQQPGKLQTGSDVQAIKRLVKNQQIRLRHQRLTEQRFTRFSGGEIFKAALEQRRNTEQFCQARTASGIFGLFLDNLFRRAAGVLFAWAK